jgi:NDP-sugar pyrophosphorylase family protein
MHAFILAGGLGTRLRPFSFTIPKPLLPIGDRPIIDILLTQLSNCGFTSATISLGYLAPLFRAFVGDGNQWGLNVEFVVENEPLGTAGALRLARDLPDHFLVVNGDTLTDLDFGDMLRNHYNAGAVASIFCADIADYVDYGVVAFDADGTLLSYNEKPTHHYHVSTGVYAVSKSILRYDPQHGRLDMPTLFLTARDAGERIYCYRSPEVYWRDIGRFDHLEEASRDFEMMRSKFLRQGDGAMT